MGERAIRPRARRDTYTTGEVAFLCQVAPRTVSKWVDAGKLQGVRLPSGKRDRRVRRDDLLTFMREHGFSTDDVVPSRPVLLTVALEPLLSARLADFGGCDLLLAADGFDAGRHAASWWDAAVVSLAGVGVRVGLGLGRRLKEQGGHARLVALVGDDGAGQGEAASYGFSAALRPPWAAVEVLRWCGVALKHGGAPS